MTRVPLAIPPAALERLLAELADELSALECNGLRRTLTIVESLRGAVAEIQGREVVCWCTNDYLGLASHPALAEAAGRAIGLRGVGAGASRLLAGTSRWHRQLEERLAQWWGAEEALVFPTGYQTNLGTLGALLTSRDAVFVDRLSHASLLDAARASRARFRVFEHNDPGHLLSLLKHAPSARRRLIVTEGIFSMEGDAPPLAELLDVADAQGALVYLDDAHGAFVMGERGRGTPEAAGVAPGRFLYMGTLGKALGCQGGFIVGPRTLIDILQTRARTFIYTTAMAIPIAAAGVAALRVLEQEPQRRRLLQHRAVALRSRLGDAGLASLQPLLPGGVAPYIIPVIVGSAERAVRLSRRLWEQGIWAPAVRPPTVPEGTARLRLSVSALHTEQQIDQLGGALTHALTELSKVG